MPCTVLRVATELSHHVHPPRQQTLRDAVIFRAKSRSGSLSVATPQRQVSATPAQQAQRRASGSTTYSSVRGSASTFGGSSGIGAGSSSASPVAGDGSRRSLGAANSPANRGLLKSSRLASGGDLGVTGTTDAELGATRVAEKGHGSSSDSDSDLSDAAPVQLGGGGGAAHGQAGVSVGGGGSGGGMHRGLSRQDGGLMAARNRLTGIGEARQGGLGGGFGDADDSESSDSDLSETVEVTDALDDLLDPLCEDTLAEVTKEGSVVERECQPNVC